VSEGQLADLLRYRIAEAHETLREAQVLLDAEALRGATNRAYYAMFYAVLALLATKGLGTSKHGGAIALFDREFVKTGLFPPDMSRSLHTAFDLRQTHDYAELVSNPDRATAEDLVAESGTFVTAVESYLRATALM